MKGVSAFLIWYRFGDVDVYCPWDVVSYVNKLRVKRTLPPKDYWSNTSSNDVVRHFLEMAKPDTRDEIERLIAGESVAKVINDEPGADGASWSG